MTTPKEEPADMLEGMKLQLNGWIAREFSGYGRAIRRKDDDPYPGEPYMSMEDAKELTRRAVAEFVTAYGSIDMLEGMGRETAELIARLNKIVKSYTAAEWDSGGIPRICSEAAIALAAKDKEIARLHERLEDNHVFRVNQDGQMERVEVTPGSIPDGIEARDITIKMQDEALAAKDAEIAELRDQLKHVDALLCGHTGVPEQGFVKIYTARAALTARDELPNDSLKQQ